MSVYDILCMPLRELMPLSMIIVFAFIFGSCLGSFLNVCIWRIPLGESVVVVPSHCPKCNHKIRWFDNVPMIGYLALGGKCRDCKAPISPRYIIMELLVGVLFTVPAIMIYMGNGAAKDLIALTIVLSVIVPCAFIDVEYRKLPDKLTYFGMISGVLYNWVFIAGRGMTHADSLLWSLSGLFAGVIGLGVFAWITAKLLKKKDFGHRRCKICRICGGGARHSRIAAYALSGVYSGDCRIYYCKNILQKNFPRQHGSVRSLSGRGGLYNIYIMLADCGGVNYLPEPLA